MNEFSGIWVPLVTPFRVDSSVDHENLAKLVHKLVAAGVAGLVVGGTTGEPATWETGEAEAVLQTVLACRATLPVIMGVNGIAPAEVSRQVSRWQQYPLAGFLLPPPYYVRPTQQGIINFYSEVAAASDLPLVVYDIPYRTGVAIELDTFRALADVPGIRATKDCGGNARKTQMLIAEQRLQVLAGEDSLIFTTLCQGGTGAIAASAHLHPELFVAMHRSIVSGDWPAARRIHHALAPLIETLFIEPNPAPLKAVLAALGEMQACVRAPLLAASAGTARAAGHAHRCLAEQNLLFKS